MNKINAYKTYNITDFISIITKNKIINKKIKKINKTFGYMSLKLIILLIL